MSTFVDDYGVTYPNPNGGKPFRVMIHQKPNPIGFHARLPGDAPKRKP